MTQHLLKIREPSLNGTAGLVSKVVNDSWGQGIHTWVMVSEHPIGDVHFTRSSEMIM